MVARGQVMNAAIDHQPAKPRCTTRAPCAADGLRSLARQGLGLRIRRSPRCTGRPKPRPANGLCDVGGRCAGPCAVIR
jgi:hypothetical protein